MPLFYMQNKNNNFLN